MESFTQITKDKSSKYVAKLGVRTSLTLNEFKGRIYAHFGDGAKTFTLRIEELETLLQMKEATKKVKEALQCEAEKERKEACAAAEAAARIHESPDQTKKRKRIVNDDSDEEEVITIN